MQQFDIPIIHRTYELYRALYNLEKSIPKSARYSLWNKCENTSLSILEGFLQVGYISPEKRAEQLNRVSAQVDMLRVFLRLSFDIKAIDKKKYISLQATTDEIGRMLGGWLKSVKQK